MISFHIQPAPGGAPPPGRRPIFAAARPVAAAALIAAAVLAGCGGAPNGAEGAHAPDQRPAEAREKPAAAAAKQAGIPRIVSTDGGVTETLFALGAGDWVIARDSGSTYPPEAEALPDIGVGHQISAEAVLTLRPTLVIGRDRPMSRPGFQILESAGIPVLRLDDAPGIDGARERIRAIAAAIGRESEAEEIIAAMDQNLERLARKRAALDGAPPPRALIVYLRPDVTVLMGEDSNAMALARLAGAEAATPGVTGYKPLNAEAAVAARPDVILCYADGLESIGGIPALLKRPGIAETPAARNGRIIALPDLLLAGFGPRTGAAALELFHALHLPAEDRGAMAANP